ncbi:MAG: DUF192 domain-containing protein, partial [Candidatus Paceibacterota bacterium]
MTRYHYAGILIISIVIGGALYAYKTEAPSLQQADFGGVSLSIEVAATPEVRERGLGGRMSVPDGYGMLFSFPEDSLYGFWMKGMLMPIDIFWLDDKGQVVSMATSVTPSSYPRVFYPAVPARYVLET